MSDANNPDQQVATPDQQVDWQARYNGQQAKLQAQAGTIQALTNQVATLQQQLSEANAQLGVRDAQRTQEVGQRDQTISQLQSEVQALKGQLTPLQSDQRKLATIKKLNRPDLIQVMDAVPASEDPAAMEAAFTSLAGYADSLVRAREQQLTAGVTTTGGGASAVQSVAKPSTSAGWQDHVNSLGLGTPEREKAMSDWYEWSRANPNS
jgi:chromosome segregation ATPase